MSFLVVINPCVSMFPLNLSLTPTHSINITTIIKRCFGNVYLIELSHVTVKIYISSPIINQIFA